LVVDKSKSQAELDEVVKGQKIKILKETRVFDIYEGRPLGSDQKAVSMAFFFSRPDSTLTDKEADAVMDKLITAFVSSGVDIRR
jgi:phenylalanyl-tRNA synthetase beta chain